MGRDFFVALFGTMIHVSECQRFWDHDSYQRVLVLREKLAFFGCDVTHVDVM
jgi:hypothetical protein